MFQSFLSKYSKTKPAEDYAVPPLWGTREKKMFVFLGLFCSRCCTRRNLRFYVEKLSTRRSKTAHATIGLRSRHRSNPRPTRFVSGKTGECRWRPRRCQVDPWSRGREVTRGVLYALLPNLKKGLFVAIGEGSRIFVACFLHSSVQMCLWPEGGSEPLTGAPRSDFMAQSLVLSIDVSPGLGISPLRLNIWLSFSQADLGQRSAQEWFCSGF